MLQEIAAVLPAGWQYPEVRAARIIYDQSTFTSVNYALGLHIQQARFTTFHSKEGMMKVVYTKGGRLLNVHFLPKKELLLICWRICHWYQFRGVLKQRH